MTDMHPVEALRRWLAQQIEAGENVVLARPLQSDAASASAKSAPSGSARSNSASANSASANTASANSAPVSDGASGPTAADAADDSLEKIAAEVRACTACPLHETRQQAVPGVGPEDAGLVFVGEGPGAEEDIQGKPFVGRAGQLLTRIIESVDLQRDAVFITNIVKCRPPGNRDPRPEEVAACEPFLRRQLRVLQPRVICALGRHAATTLLRKQDSMAKLRTGEHSYEGVRVFPTYHPAALLRNPQWKRPVWEDIQNIRRAYDSPHENP